MSNAERLTTALAGRYRIERELGAGGMATVYLAQDLKHKRKVAIKVLRDELAAALGPERFLREIETTASLRHPHILPLYDSGEAGGFLYYVMPLIEGESLRERLDRERELPVEDALQVAREVADALGYAHGRGVVHRDIKPENILLEGGHAVVADFGIARAVSALGGGHLTQTGLAVGTPAYMSPEQVLADRDLDGRSDLYSLGCVLHEMLAGEPPFAASTSQRTIARRLTEAPPDLCAARPSVPRAVSEVVRRCLALDPGERYATGPELTQALARAGTGETPAQPGADAGRTEPRLPWMAVLPFASRDPALADLAEGLAEDITTGLSRFAHLQVVARQTAARLPAGGDVRRVGEALGARYAIEGSLRKSGDTVRLSVQLVDTRTGTHLWAETFDRDLGASSIFAVQDDLADRIVATVADPFGVLVRVMAHPLLDQPVEELTAQELCLRLYAHNQQLGPEEHGRLRRGLELALEREPRHADAWAALATLYWAERQHGINLQPDPLGRALRAAQRAVQLAPASESAWAALAEAQYFGGDLAAFRQSSERAIALNPRNTGTVAIMAMLIAYGGEWERGLGLIRRMMDLNPHHPGWLYFVPCHYHIKQGDYEAALAAVKRVNMPEFPWTWSITAIVCAELGRWDEARAAVEGLRRLFAGIESMQRLGVSSNGWFHDTELEEREAAGWRKAVAGPVAAAPAAGPSPSVAVLPFANMSADPQDEFFADGITEEIINALAQLPGLSVAARTSAFAFKGKHEDLRAVGEKLGVTSVLEGSVRKAGARLRITAQLINVADGYHAWSERYDREMTDIFAVQDEIAAAIASRLKLTIGAGGPGARVRPATSNLEAYQLLLKGRVLHAQRGPAIARAREAFEQALLLDPGLAEAHALLGDAFRLFAIYGMAPTAEVIPKARAAAERALALDPGQVEALATLSSLAAIFDWDWAACNALAERALAIDPRHVRVMVERAFVATYRRGATPADQAQAIAQFEAAVRTDPLNAWAAGVHSFGLASVGRAPEAVAEARRAIELDPASFTGRWALVWALGAAGRNAEVLEAAEPALLMSGRGSRILADAAAAHARLGNRAAAEDIFREITTRAKGGYVGWSEQGAIAASAGRLEEARALVARGIEARESFLAFLTCPSWGPFQADRACRAMLEEVGP